MNTILFRHPLPRTRRMLACAALALLAGCAESPHDLVIRGERARLEERLAADPAQATLQNKLGKTPLHCAVTMRRRDMLDLLKRHGADLNAQDKTGMTPLHVAAMMGRPEEAR